MQQESTAGYVTLPDFIAKFGLKGSRSMKSAAGTVLKRRRDEGYALIDKPLGVGRPPKAARVTDLKHSYDPKRGAVRNIGQSLGLSSVRGNIQKRLRSYVKSQC